MQKIRVANVYPQVPLEISGRRPSLGQAGQVSIFPVLVGLGGAAALYAAKDSEGTQKMGLTAAGWAGITYGVWSLLSGLGTAKPRADSAPSAAISDVPSFAQVSAAFISPINGGKVEAGTFSHKYPVKVLVSNASGKQVEVFWQIISREYAERAIGSTSNEGQVGQGIWKLAGSDSKEIPLELLRLSSLWLSPKVTANLSLQIRRSASEGWKQVAIVNFEVI